MPKQKNRTLTKMRRYWSLYLMLVPGILYLIVNNYLPLFGLTIAFKKVNYAVGILNSEWCGLKNFSFLFSTKEAFLMFRNTIGYNLAFIFIGNAFGLLIAITMDTVKNRFFKNVSQIIILFPYLLSIGIVTYIVFSFLSPSSGFMNQTILRFFGMEPVSWYNNPKPWPVILVIVYIWMSFGYTSILYYSTLIGIDKSLYEAAAMDGAGSWQQIKNVTIPCMRKIIIIMFILAIGKICYSDFGLFYQVPMHSGMLQNVTQTIDTYVYTALLEQNNISRSAAAGFLQSMLGFVLVLITNKIVNRFDSESAMF